MLSESFYFEIYFYNIKLHSMNNTYVCKSTYIYDF